MSPEKRDIDPERPGAVAAGKIGSDPAQATPDPVGVEAAPDKSELPDDPEVLRAQIDEARAELGDTVEALTAKADVKGQVKEKVDERKQQVSDNPAPYAAGAVIALLVLVLLRRRGRQ